MRRNRLFWMIGLFLSCLPAWLAAQPRVLIIDKNMSPWPKLAPVAAPWVATGCEVHYRRYFPFFVKDDLRNYDILILCGGRTPLLPGAQTTRQDLDLLKEAVLQGKGVVLAYHATPGGEGAYDRAAMNQLLRELDVRLQIGDVLLNDPEHTYLTSTTTGMLMRKAPEWPHSGVDRFPFGVVAPLKVLKDARVEVFATAYESAYFRKKKTAFRGYLPAGLFLQPAGPILVLPRAAFEVQAAGLRESFAPILRPDWTDSTRQFLVDVTQRFLDLVQGAELTLTPVPTLTSIPTYAESRLASLPVPETIPSRNRLPVVPFSFRRSHFPDREVIQLHEQEYVERLRSRETMKPILKRGIRAIQGRLTAFIRNGKKITPEKSREEIDLLMRFMKAAGLNMLITVNTPQAVSNAGGYSADEALLIQNDWKRLLRSLFNHKLNTLWIPGLDPRDHRFHSNPVVALDGRVHALRTPIDFKFWWDGYITPLKSMASALVDYQPTFSGIFLELQAVDAYPSTHYLMGHDFSDQTYLYVLSLIRGILPAETLEIAQEQASNRRFGFLAREGLLPLYYTILEDAVEQFARKLRRELEKLSPNLLWVVSGPELPGDWFALGLLRGLSDPENPVIYVSPEAVVQPNLLWLRDQDIYLLHVMSLYASRFSADALTTILQWLPQTHHGFCLQSWEYLSDLFGAQKQRQIQTLQSILRDSRWHRSN